MADLEKEKQKLIAKSHLRQIAREKGSRFVIDCVENGALAKKAKTAEKEDIKNNLLGGLDLESLEEVSVNDLLHVLENQNLIERISHRKAAGASSNKNFVKMKGKRV